MLHTFSKIQTPLAIRQKNVHKQTHTQTHTDFSKGDKWLRVGASRLRVPASLEVLECWYILCKIDFYMCNICAI